MSRGLQLVLVLLSLFCAGGAQGGEVLDRIVATVGKRAILQSELTDAVRFEMFAAGRPLASVTFDDLKSTLNRTIDQQLIKNDIGDTDAFVAAPDDVNRRINEIRAQIPEAATDAGLQSILKGYGLTDSFVRERVSSELETMRMVNQKLRPSVRIDQAEIEAAYKNEFAPKLRQAGAAVPPLAELSSRIRQILVERHISELLDSWVQSLRSQADVRIHAEELQSREYLSGSSRTSNVSAEDVQ